MVGAQSSVGKFPMFQNGRYFSPWSLHQSYLDRLPALSTIRDSERTWISSLLGLSLSDRERAMRDASPGTAKHSDLLMNIKESLTSIFLGFAGDSPYGVQRLFGLNDSESKNNMGVYTLIFVTDLRLDLAAHSIIAEAWILPLTHTVVGGTVMRAIEENMASLLQIMMDEEEVRGWMRLLPASNAAEHGLTREVAHISRDRPLFRSIVVKARFVNAVKESVRRRRLSSTQPGDDSRHMLPELPSLPCSQYRSWNLLGRPFRTILLQSLPRPQHKVPALPVGSRKRGCLHVASARRSNIVG
jgi:hypothetical protein